MRDPTAGHGFERVLHHFGMLCTIPRGSGNEKAASDFIADAAAALGLSHEQDGAGNVVVRKPASPGREGAPGVILQSHIDMVCEKTPESPHDFLTDPIRLVRDGDLLRADGTTLGADDGIGAAMALALLEDIGLPHPALEAVFTTDEERGMNGARSLDPSLLRHRRLINIDMEREGAFTVSCAGGVRLDVRLPAPRRTAPTEAKFFELTVDGLRGGHSGLEIDKGRANANVLLGRALDALGALDGLVLGELSGGSKDNAIAKTARAVVGVAPGVADPAAARMAGLERIFQAEYALTDPGLSLRFAAANAPPAVFAGDVLPRVTALILLFPDGVRGMSAAVPGLVESSCNLGVLREKNGVLSLTCSARSSVSSRKALIAAQIARLADALGAEVSLSGDYPAWEYRESSPLRELMRSVFVKQYGREPVLSAVHAGLECGLWAEKMPDADMIAIGPDITGAHTPEETLSVSSAGRVWAFLLECLASM